MTDPIDKQLTDPLGNQLLIFNLRIKMVINIFGRLVLVLQIQFFLLIYKNILYTKVLKSRLEIQPGL